MPPLLRDLTLTDGQPAIEFAGHRFAKLLPTCPDEVEWFSREGSDGGMGPAALLSHAADVARVRERRLRELAMDGATARLVLRLLRGLRRGEIVLLEGPPGTSKTSSVELAAALLGLLVMRVSFSRDSDASEFIGKYVPKEEGAGFRWQDGPVLRAMRDGQLLYLDEVNLARAAHLDRLLPVLEQHPSLALVEHLGERVDASPNFRVLMTINSVGDEGRIPLSRPFRDRTVAAFTTEPDVLATRAMLQHWMRGRGQAQVTVGGRKFTIPTLPQAQRVAPTLARVDGLRERLPAMARFHHAVAALAANRDLGLDRREGYSFGRRRLAGFVRALETEAAVLVEESKRPSVRLDDAFRQVLAEHYFEAVESPEDRKAVEDQARNLLLEDLGPLSVAGPRPPLREAHGGREVPVEGLLKGSPVVYQGLDYRVRQVTATTIRLEDEDRLSGPQLLRKRAQATQLDDGTVLLAERED